MNRSRLRYQPDEWSHDLDQWWLPLASLAARSGCGSDAWRSVLGVEKFFDHRLLEQPRVLRPWICLAAAAVAARAARDEAETATRVGPGTGAAAARWALAATAFDLAVALQELRWQDAEFTTGPISTRELIDTGRYALAARGHAPVRGNPAAVYLVAGWLAHSEGTVPAPRQARAAQPQLTDDMPVADRAIENIAAIASSAAGSGPLVWGTAHLAERLVSGSLDRPPPPVRPTDPPGEAQANVLLAAGRGQVGLVEARRYQSKLAATGIVVPDLARMAFIHGNADFLASIASAFTAAGHAGPLERPGELISWNIQLSGGAHPLAERTVSGRSAGLGAYVAFRSLSHLGVFADKDVAFTGQVFPDGRVGKVRGASDKLEAAHHRGIRLVVYPKGQPWLDPEVSVRLEGVQTGEDALIAAAPQLRGLRSYLEAACRLVAPEPWLRTWLHKQGRDGDTMPLLTVIARQLSPIHEAVPDRNGPTLGSSAEDAMPKEPEISPCPAHLLASTYPGYSFAISADAGGGNTLAAKRMVAEAARQALSGLRALSEDQRLPGFTLPLYLPLGELPTSWDSLVQASVAALPALAESGLEIAAAVAGALRADSPRTWQPLLVVDGTDRTGRGNSDGNGEKERELRRPDYGPPASRVPKLAAR